MSTFHEQSDAVLDAADKQVADLKAAIANQANLLNAQTVLAEQFQAALADVRQQFAIYRHEHPVA